MTPRIRVLPDHVANQIAAGEVVERPASVVKELVENALDAEADRVDVTLRNGGKTEIRVADDGVGMAREDALLALDRHATSKISEADDLTRISSLGFRGEALPSIAAVSRFELETAPEDADAGTRVRAKAGSISGVDEVARRPGTTVTVRGLFQSVPARAKFLRSAGAETRACSEALTLLALAHLDVAFRLESNGRDLLDLPAVDALRSRVADLWGEEEASDLIPVDLARDEIRVGGLVLRPDAARRGGRRRYLFVNGRPFRDKALNRAVDEAYRTTVPAEASPTFLLYLSVPPETVDVNVHPAKAEVRFRRREEVEEVVRAAVRERLGELDSSASVTREPGADYGAASAGGAGTDEPAGAGAASGSEASAGPEEASPDSQLAFFLSGGAGAAMEPDGEGPARASKLAGHRPELWQLHDSYLLAATREGLLIVDQHAAHERVLFERIMARFAGEQEGTSQRLLFPITVRLDPAEYSAVQELEGLLRRTGYEVRPFGERTVIIHASPDPHPYFDAERCFREMIRELTHGSALVDSARNQHERIAKSLACKGAIKAGQPLGGEEMRELFDQLFATELPGHDVHGRPTVVRLTLAELERRFGRS